MNRFAYYQQLKVLAREIRADFNLTAPRVLKSDLRLIYKAKGITRIDLWPRKGIAFKFKQLRGAYLRDAPGPSVMLARHLPLEPMIFTMAHELKHHLTDQELPVSYCDKSNEAESIEIGAEVFAAELIFPDQDFAAWMDKLHIGLGNCTPKALVQLKHTTRTTLSYQALAKKAEFLNFATEDSLKKVGWKKLEEEIYGEPIYKRVLRYRRRY